MMFLGLDPGSTSGCLAVGDQPEPSSSLNIRSFPFKDLTTKETFLLFQKIASTPGEKFAMLEKLAPIPGRGMKSMLTFWTHYGGLIMALTANDIPYQLVPPQTWQKEYGLLKKKTKYNEEGKFIKSKDKQKKTANKEVAERLFPGYPIDFVNADAFLILDYARRVWGNRDLTGK